MHYEQFLGLGVGVPQYHDRDHLEVYNHDEVKSVDGDMPILIDIIDEIVYDSEVTPQTITPPGAEGHMVRTEFRQEYDRPGDPEVRGDFGDTIRLQINHTKYLGKSALQQEYSLLIETMIERKNTPAYSLVTKYFIEQVNDPNFPYYATVLRPDILTAGNVDDDMMTFYDCNQLFDDLMAIKDLAPISERSS